MVAHTAGLVHDVEKGITQFLQDQAGTMSATCRALEVAERVTAWPLKSTHRCSHPASIGEGREGRLDRWTILRRS